jgi:uncharacterized membrane protein YfcA
VYGEAAAILGSAFASSIAGFAFSAICGAFLFHDGSAPRHIVQLMVMCSIAIQGLSVAAFSRSIRWRALLPFFCGGACGLPIGLFALLHVRTSAYVQAMGIFLVVYGAIAIDTFVGFLAGITGGAAGFPGACMTIWCAHRGWDNVQQRSMNQPFILLMQIITVAALLATDPAASEHAARLDLSALAFVPVALCGTYLGLGVFRRLSDRGFTRYLALLLVVSGIGLVGVR